MMFVKSAKLTTQKLEDGKLTLVFQNANIFLCAHMLQKSFTLMLLFNKNLNQLSEINTFLFYVV